LAFFLFFIREGLTGSTQTFIEFCMKEILDFLSAIQPLSPDLRAQLEKILLSRELGKKELLLDVGQVCRNICFVESGLFRCYYISRGKEVCSWFMKERDVIASVGSFYRQRPSYERIQALEPSRIYYISHQELQDIYEDYPEFNLHGRKLTEQYYQLWDEQLRLLRMERVQERYQYMLEHHPELERRVPRGCMASYLGITQETLSRMGRG
jgi:CRP/FNR family transcriptional regulator, anaerobic regulatory protein